MRVTSPPNLFANELRTTFSVVPQESVLFSGTIYDDVSVMAIGQFNA
jgi:ABC-type multidrug transport system fused ATPase/permease subunit